VYILIDVSSAHVVLILFILYTPRGNLNESITKKGIINANRVDTGYVLCKIRKKSINERTSRSAE